VCLRSCASVWLSFINSSFCFHMVLDVLSTALHIRLFLSFSLWGVTLHLWLVFGSYGVPFFSLCSWWRKDVSHDVVWDVFVATAKYARFHVSQKQTCVLLPFALQSSHHQVNIVLLVDDVHTLAYVVITNPIWIDLVLGVAIFVRLLQ
jgi:hypothetical protein